MIIKLTLRHAIVACPRSSILIQNHSAFHEYFANKSQIKASLSLEIVKKTCRDRMQRPKKVCDRKLMLPCSSFPVAHKHFSDWPDFREFWLPFPFVLFMYCYTKSQSKNSKNIHEIPLFQSFSRRPTADKEPGKLWARDCTKPEDHTKLSLLLPNCKNSCFHDVMLSVKSGNENGLMDSNFKQSIH